MIYKDKFKQQKKKTIKKSLSLTLSLIRIIKKNICRYNVFIMFERNNLLHSTRLFILKKIYIRKIKLKISSPDLDSNHFPTESPIAVQTFTPKVSKHIATTASLKSSKQH